MAERSNAAVLKTVGGIALPGFESLSLRQNKKFSLPCVCYSLCLSCKTLMLEEGCRSVINVLLVDDHDLVRGGIKKILNDTAGIKVVAEARSGEEAVQLSRKLH